MVLFLLLLVREGALGALRRRADRRKARLLLVGLLLLFLRGEWLCELFVQDRVELCVGLLLGGRGGGGRLLRLLELLELVLEILLLRGGSLTGFDLVV